jgi:alkanesulfonate monooxygenase
MDRDRCRHRRRGNTTILAGAPEQVAESLLAHYDLGVATFLNRASDPL